MSGNITNALTGDNMSGVGMWYANGMNKDYYIDGGFTKFDNTDSNGAWSLSKNAGWYTINSWKSGYYDGYVNVFACGNQPNQNNSLRATLNEGEMSILLTWPRTDPVTGTDLDSHLYIPIIDIDSSRGGDCDGDGDKDDKCHLYYRSIQDTPAVYNGVSTRNYHIYGDNSTGDNVTLDRDRTSSPGDENTTISKVGSGTYSFSVHNLTNSDNSSHTNLAQSRAKVRVWYNKGGTLIKKKFHPPNANGTLWRVFTFNSSDSGGSGFTRVRTMTYQKTPADVY
jgi:hypothetical protein